MPTYCRMKMHANVSGLVDNVSVSGRGDTRSVIGAYAAATTQRPKQVSRASTEEPTQKIETSLANMHVAEEPTSLVYIHGANRMATKKNNK